MDDDKLLKPPHKPCGSCPYRKDVPSGIWDEEEYKKLPQYDEETPYQPFGIFMCHQKDGCICGGWLLTHDKEHLISLRLKAHELHPSVWSYKPDTEVFSSGAEAAAHGIKDIDSPGQDAIKKIKGIMKLRGE